MKYISTRTGIEATAQETVFQGLAPDGGKETLKTIINTIMTICSAIAALLTTSACIHHINTI